VTLDVDLLFYCLEVLARWLVSIRHSGEPLAGAKFKMDEPRGRARAPAKVYLWLVLLARPPGSSHNLGSSQYATDANGFVTQMQVQFVDSSNITYSNTKYE